MTISLINDKIEITSGAYTLAELSSAVGDDVFMVTIGTSHVIHKNVIIHDQGELIGSSEDILFLGDMFQINKGGTLRLGSNVDNVIRDGCTFRCPNLMPSFGFGNPVSADSGNFIAYGSNLDIFTMWGLHGGHNLVLVDTCIVSGYGMISGDSSEYVNNKIVKYHGIYGGIIPRGTIGKIYGNDVLTGTDEGGVRCPIYHDARLMSDVLIRNTKFQNYTHIVYHEQSDIMGSVTLLDCMITDSRAIKRKSTTGTYLEKYTTRFKLLATDGQSLIDTEVEIKNALGHVVAREVSDSNGCITIVLTALEIDGFDNSIRHTPHMVSVKSPIYNMNFIHSASLNHSITPVVVTNSIASAGQIDRILVTDIVDTAITEMNKRNKARFDSIDTGIRNLLKSMGPNSVVTMDTAVSDCGIITMG